MVLDRIDEPTLISGDPDRMRAVIWPIMNNKFLQQEGIGFKMLLPIELRHELFRESNAFFQEELVVHDVGVLDSAFDLGCVCNQMVCSGVVRGAPPCEAD